MTETTRALLSCAIPEVTGLRSLIVVRCEGHLPAMLVGKENLPHAPVVPTGFEMQYGRR